MDGCSVNLDGVTEIWCLEMCHWAVKGDCGVGSDQWWYGKQSVKLEFLKERECDGRVCASVTATRSEKSSWSNESLIELPELPHKKIDKKLAWKIVFESWEV